MNLLRWLRDLPQNTPVHLCPEGSHLKELEELLEVLSTNLLAGRRSNA